MGVIFFWGIAVPIFRLNDNCYSLARTLSASRFVVAIDPSLVSSTTRWPSPVAKAIVTISFAREKGKGMSAVWNLSRFAGLTISRKKRRPAKRPLRPEPLESRLMMCADLAIAPAGMNAGGDSDIRMSLRNGDSFIQTAPANDGSPEILSAYLGAVDVRFPQALANVSGSDQQPGDEGMPIVLSVQVDAATLAPEDFAVTTSSGAVMTPSAVTLSPADEADELRTILLTGPLGSADDLPTNVEIVGSVLSVAGEELVGLASEVTTADNGPSLVLALVDPGEVSDDGEATPTRIQTTWQGGVTGRFGRPIGIRQLRGIRIIDVNGDLHAPIGFEDRGDNDNHLVLIVPPGVTPAGVAVREGTLFDPTNQPNPETAVEITGTIVLEEESNSESSPRGVMGPRQLLRRLRAGVRRAPIVAIEPPDARDGFVSRPIGDHERGMADTPMFEGERLLPRDVDVVFEQQMNSPENEAPSAQAPPERPAHRLVYVRRLR